MRIISTLLPAEETPELVEGRQAVLMAFDTLVDEKSLVVGITVGKLDGPNIDDVRVSAIGQHIINRCARHHQTNYPDGTVVVAGVASVSGAKQRTRDVLAKAPPDSFVLLVAADGKTYDAAFKELGVDFKASHIGAQ